MSTANLIETAIGVMYCVIGVVGVVLVLVVVSFVIDARKYK